jgi:hypothetical protein
MVPQYSRVFAFEFDNAYRWPALLFGITPRRAWVELNEDGLTARFSRWSLQTTLSNISQISVAGPYRYLKTAGPAHLSMKDHGLTFATSGRRGVCLEFFQAVSGIDPLGRIKHPSLTVTLADPAEFCREFDRARTASAG